jgi:hypothetical protein
MLRDSKKEDVWEGIEKHVPSLTDVVDLKKKNSSTEIQNPR